MVEESHAALWIAIILILVGIIMIVIGLWWRSNINAYNKKNNPKSPKNNPTSLASDSTPPKSTKPAWIVFSIGIALLIVAIIMLVFHFMPKHTTAIVAAV
jgi:uncharacterized membrane protein HdeD (DUF308 family)